MNNVRLEEKLPNGDTSYGSEASADSESIGGHKKLRPPGLFPRSLSH